MPAEKLTQLTQLPLPPQPTDQLYIVRPSEGFAGSHSIQYGSLLSGVSGLARALTPLTTVSDITLGTVFYTIPPNTLRTDNDYLRVSQSGLIANNGNSKSITPGIDITGFVGFDLFSLPQDSISGGVVGGLSIFGGWKTTIVVIRLTLDTMRVSAEFMAGAWTINADGTPNSVGAAILGGSVDQTTPGFDFAINQFRVYVLGNGSPDDLTLSLVTCEVYNF